MKSGDSEVTIPTIFLKETHSVTSVKHIDTLKITLTQGSKIDETSLVYVVMDCHN